jgi:hypothetical protein
VIVFSHGTGSNWGGQIRTVCFHVTAAMRAHPDYLESVGRVERKPAA